MEISNRYCFHIGTARGLLATTRCCTEEPAKFNSENVAKSNAVTSLAWGRTENEIVIGYNSGFVKLFDTVLGTYTNATMGDESEDAVVGADVVHKNIVIGRKSGHVNIWRKKSRGGFKLSLEEKATLETMVHNKNRQSVIGTGGERNDFKLWDVETKQCIFKAKSMGHDELNLPLPTTIRSICFFPSDDKLSACVTKEGYVLLYDDRAQRRPVSKFVEPRASYTVVAATCSGMQCVAGTTRGYMQVVDLKSPSKCVKAFKSFAGSVTDVVCDPMAPLVASVSLDRYLRIHNIHTKELLYKEYLKQNLTKLIMKPVIKDEPTEKEVAENVEEVDEEYEQLFDSMEAVGDADKNTPKRKLSDGRSLKSLKKSKRKN